MHPCDASAVCFAPRRDDVAVTRHVSFFAPLSDSRKRSPLTDLAWAMQWFAGACLRAVTSSRGDADSDMRSMRMDARASHRSRLDGSGRSAAQPFVATLCGIRISFHKRFARMAGTLHTHTDAAVKARASHAAYGASRRRFRLTSHVCAPPEFARPANAHLWADRSPQHAPGRNPEMSVPHTLHQKTSIHRRSSRPAQSRHSFNR